MGDNSHKDLLALQTPSRRLVFTSKVAGTSRHLDYVGYLLFGLVSIHKLTSERTLCDSSLLAY